MITPGGERVKTLMKPLCSKLKFNSVSDSKLDACSNITVYFDHFFLTQ